MEKHQITIIYATETGTSEDIAYKIHLLLNENNIKNELINIMDYNINNLPNQLLVIFIVSTTGNGDIPSSMTSFWRFLLKKSLDNTSLCNIKHAIYGLGDSSYQNYNTTSRKLNIRLKQLGSKEFIPIGLGDDQAKYGYLTTLDDWINQLLITIKNELSFVININRVNNNIDSNNSKYRISLCNDKSNSYKINFKPPNNLRNQCEFPLIGKITNNLRMTSDDWFQDVRHISIEIVDNKLTNPIIYLPGDIITIYPRNKKDFIIRLYNRIKSNCDYQLTDVLIIEPLTSIRSSRINQSITCSLYDLLSIYLNISDIPQRSFFEYLSTKTVMREHSEKLLELASKEGTDLYYDYCIKEKRNCIEILEDFASCRIDLCDLIDLIPLMRPRHYSIASCMNENPNNIDICVGLVRTKTRYSRVYEGVCSSYLINSHINDYIYFYITTGLIQSIQPIINDLTNPLILIGPGTGIAPMRAIVKHRIQLLNQIGSCLSSDLFILFLGNRHIDKDFLYCNEWDIFTSNQLSNDFIDKSLDNSIRSYNYNNSTMYLSTAFSRQEINKHYVNNNIEKYGKYLYDLIVNRNGYIVISGNAKKMPMDVRKKFVEIMQLYGNLNEKDADMYIKKLENTRRYIVEAWS